MKALTARQQQALDIIRESVRTRSIPPTLREMGQLMGIRSTNGVDDHLQALERKGYITRSEMLSRSIRLVAPMVEAKTEDEAIAKWNEENL